MPQFQKKKNSACRADRHTLQMHCYELCVIDTLHSVTNFHSLPHKQESFCCLLLFWYCLQCCAKHSQHVRSAKNTLTRSNDAGKSATAPHKFALSLYGAKALLRTVFTCYIITCESRNKLQGFCNLLFLIALCANWKGDNSAVQNSWKQNLKKKKNCTYKR